MHLLKATFPTRISARFSLSKAFPPTLLHLPLEDEFLHKLHKFCTIAKKLLRLKATCISPRNTVFPFVLQMQKPLMTQKIPIFARQAFPFASEKISFSTRTMHVDHNNPQAVREVNS